MLGAIAFERGNCIDHMLDHAGACDLAVLGHMAHQNDARPARLRIADQALRRATNLGHGTGRRVDRVRPHGLDRVDDHEAGRGTF